MRSGAKRNELATKKVCDADVDLSIHTISNIILLWNCVLNPFNGQENKKASAIFFERKMKNYYGRLPLKIDGIDVSHLAIALYYGAV